MMVLGGALFSEMLQHSFTNPAPEAITMHLDALFCHYIHDIELHLASGY